MPRNAIFMGQVPWLGKLFFRYPKFAEDLKAFRAHATNRAVIRRKEISPHKDIFHHLVSSSPCQLNFLFNELRRWTRIALHQSLLPPKK